jgi:DNA-binding IclR family transcriptional regulator
LCFGDGSIAVNMVRNTGGTVVGDMGESGATGLTGRPLRKALAVLEALGAAGRPLSLSELSELVDLPKSTVHRLIRILTDVRLAAQTRWKCYELGDYLFELTRGHDRDDIRGVGYPITPFLIELFQRTRQIICVATLSGTKVRYSGTLYTVDQTRQATALRQPVPAHCSAAGKLLLAKSLRYRAEFFDTAPAAYTRWTVTRLDMLRREFDLIRKTGLAYARGEYLPELVEVAAGVHLGRADPVAAIVVSGTVNQMDPKRAGRILLDTVASIEESLGGCTTDSG